jgi:hypothetical protein
MGHWNTELSCGDMCPGASPDYVPGSSAAVASEYPVLTSIIAVLSLPH